MQQQTRALQVAQEQVTQTRTFRSAFDQARNIGHHKALLSSHTHHTQIGVQGGERVVRNLGARIGHGRDKGGLARIGHTQQTHVGQHLQLQLQIATLAGKAGGLLAWSAVDSTLEAQIAKTTIAALGNGDDLTGLKQFKQHFASIGIADDGAHGHVQRNVVARSAKHIGTHTVLTTLGIVTTRVAVVHQRVQVLVGHGIHVTATATVTTVGAAKFFVFFVPERHAPIATVTSGNVDKSFVNELHKASSLQNQCEPEASGHTFT